MCCICFHDNKPCKIHDSQLQLFFHSGCLEVFVSIAKCFAAPYSYNRLVTYG